MNSHFLLLLSLSQQQLFFFYFSNNFFSAARFFFELQDSFVFCSFFLSLFFQQQHKDLVHKTLEQMDAQIYGIFRLAPSTNLGQSLGGSGDDQL
jgi:hypothetical protein